MSDPFDYETAFCRNIGWISELEQQRLRAARIAIAGLGGVGGNHLLSLARLGVGAFTIADPDHFDIANFNRQVGADTGTVGRPKIKVMETMVRKINPETEIACFPEGVNADNLDAFLNGADLFVDGLDFFVLDIRAKVFARCRELGIPAITAAPIGMGVSYLVFMPGGMTFEAYFRLRGLATERQYINFALGLTPRAYHSAYLVDPSRLDLAGKRGASSIAACNLCAGVVAAEAVKIILKRGRVRAAPWCHQFDPYRGGATATYLTWGARNPFQILKRHVGYRLFGRLSKNARPPQPPEGDSDIEKILAAAKWAPSGDNAQPWRFHIRDDRHVDIHVQIDTANVYEYGGGEPTLLAAGCLLESIRIAASRFARNCSWTPGAPGPDGTVVISVSLPPDPDVEADRLYPYLAIRSVDRRSYRARRLDSRQRTELAAALGNDYGLVFHQSLAARWRMARLSSAATDIRLRLKPAYHVHRRILDWRNRFSPDGVPVASIGLDRLTLRLMRWFMGSWRRLDFANRFLGASLISRLELDLLPGLACGAHLTILANARTGPEDRTAEILRRGQAVQRLWLTATRLGLVMQPALAPLCFARHADDGATFTTSRRLIRKAKRLAAIIGQNRGTGTGEVFFLARIGWPRTWPGIASRSIRKSLDSLTAGDRE